MWSILLPVMYISLHRFTPYLLPWQNYAWDVNNFKSRQRPMKMTDVNEDSIHLS